MRKISLIILFVFSSVLIVNAQEFEGGIHAGLTASQVQGDDYGGYNKAGFYAGAYVNYTFTQHSAFQLELNYIQKGSRHIGTRNDPNTYKLNLHYVELPLLYQYLINEHFSVEAGLALGVFVKSFEEHQYEEQVSAKDFQRLTLSFVGGVYYNINERFRLSIRTNNSITPIRPHISGKSRLFNFGQYNDLLSLGFQYSL